MALAEIVDLLRCPVCRLPLAELPARLACGAGHSFDVARQGYVNLYGGAAPQHADTGAMVAARERVLGSGAFSVLSDALAEAVHDLDTPALLDGGAGTGHYLAEVLSASSGARGVAVDISVPAARSAARRHRRIGAVVADVWAGLPVATEAADVVLSVFAPRHPREFARVLRPGGRLLVAYPLPEHLAELRALTELIGIAPDKPEKLAADLGAAGFDLARTDTLERRTLWPGTLAADAVAMGPNAFHADLPALRARLPDQILLTLAVRLTRWVRRPAR